jgi:hypothetical protein
LDHARIEKSRIFFIIDNGLDETDPQLKRILYQLMQDSDCPAAGGMWWNG